MDLSFNIFQLLILVGAINGFVWSVLIFIKRKKDVSIYLGLFVFLFTLASIKIILQEKIPYFNSHIPIPLLYQFALGPLLYLYLKSALDVNYKASGKQLWHFLPSLLFDILPASLLFIFDFTRYTYQIQKLSFISDVLACFLFIVYLYFSLSLINRYRKNSPVLKNEKKIGWAKKVMLASTLIAVTWLIYIIWVIVLNGKLVLGMMPYYPIYLIFGFCIYSIGIAGYYKPEIGLLKIPVNERNELLTKGELNNNKELILKAMISNCYYTDENITLQKLSKEIGINVKELSYIINVGFGKNFNDFVNEFRIADFKRRLEDPKNINYNLLGLAYEVGFNSKASFYRAFKKATNKTPAEFYKQQYKSI